MMESAGVRLAMDSCSMRMRFHRLLQVAIKTPGVFPKRVIPAYVPVDRQIPVAGCAQVEGVDDLRRP